VGGADLEKKFWDNKKSKNKCEISISTLPLKIFIESGFFRIFKGEKQKVVVKSSEKHISLSF